METVNCTRCESTGWYAMPGINGDIEYEACSCYKTNLVTMASTDAKNVRQELEVVDKYTEDELNMIESFSKAAFIRAGLTFKAAVSPHGKESLIKINK